MFRTLTSTLLAVVIAATPMFARPAEAGNANLERFLVGAGAVLIIGSILDNHHRHTVTQPRVVTRRHVVAPPPRVHRPVTHPVRPVRPNPPVRHDYRVLPSGCVRTLTTHTGPFRYLERRCIAQNAPRASLPNTCLRSIDGRSRDFTAYGARCLRRSGYSF